MLLGRAFPLALTLGAALAACGLDAVGSGSRSASALDGNVDAPRGTELGHRRRRCDRHVYVQAP